MYLYTIEVLNLWNMLIYSIVVLVIEFSLTGIIEIKSIYLTETHSFNYNRLKAFVASVGSNIDVRL